MQLRNVTEDYNVKEAAVLSAASFCPYCGIKLASKKVSTLMNAAGDKRIVSVAAGYVHTLALLEDGNVVACGINSYGECNVFNWKDIVAIYAGTQFSAGLKMDGTVVVTGEGASGWDLSDWTDIVNLADGDY